MAVRWKSGMRASAVAVALGAAIGVTSGAAARLQCVPYARAHSQVSLHGDARTWWAQAGHDYGRGQAPAVGAVLAFRGTARMPFGHVAVVRRIVDARHVLLDHANWSRRGAIERGVPAEDVSARGDWSAVRVWFGPIGALGSRTSPAFGFIYGRPSSPWIEAEDVFSRDG